MNVDAAREGGRALLAFSCDRHPFNVAGISPQKDTIPGFKWELKEDSERRRSKRGRESSFDVCMFSIGQLYLHKHAVVGRALLPSHRLQSLSSPPRSVRRDRRGQGERELI